MFAALNREIARRLPTRLQLELKRWRFSRQIARSAFRSPEPEFDLLGQWLKPGGAAIDIGANVGHYTLRLSQLAGPGGRVIAFEPVPATFALLAANLQSANANNVTLINAAVSNQPAAISMDIPEWTPGMSNYYRAHITSGGSGLSVLGLTIDALALPVKISVAKIDAEGHEIEILEGMRQLIARDRPVLILEQNSSELVALMEREGYWCGTMEGSPNFVMLPSGAQRPAGMRPWSAAGATTAEPQGLARSMTPGLDRPSSSMTYK